MSRLLILGAGGHAKVVAETAIASARFSEVAFLDDRCSGPDQLPRVLGFSVLGTLALALEPQDGAMLVHGQLEFQSAGRPGREHGRD
jgi:FlaA1/EpsC-like NDP-sugar epimerase